MAHLYVGLDVHQATTSAAVLSGIGKLIADSTIETKASTLLDFVKGLSGVLHVALEEGAQAAWLYDLLKPHVAEVVVCDPRQNKLLQSGNKADALDARKLAQLLRAGLLTAVYHGGQRVRTLKELARNYECLVSDSTRVMNRIKAIFRARGITCSGTGVYRTDGRDRWLEQIADGGARRRAEDLYKQLDCLTGLRREARLAMIAESRRHPASNRTSGPLSQVTAVPTGDYCERFEGEYQIKSWPVQMRPSPSPHAMPPRTTRQSYRRKVSDRTVAGK